MKDKTNKNWCSKHQVVHQKGKIYGSCRLPNGRFNEKTENILKKTGLTWDGGYYSYDEDGGFEIASDADIALCLLEWLTDKYDVEISKSINPKKTYMVGLYHYEYGEYNTKSATRSDTILEALIKATEGIE